MENIFSTQADHDRKDPLPGVLAVTILENEVNKQEKVDQTIDLFGHAPPGRLVFHNILLMEILMKNKFTTALGIESKGDNG